MEYLDELMAYLTEEERKKQDAVLSLAIQRVKEEAAHLRKTSFGHTDNTVHRPRLPPQDVESDTTASRLLLAHGIPLLPLLPLPRPRVCSLLM